jgi:predicted solute-binding protein
MEKTLKKARSSENKLSHSPSLRTSPSTHVHSVGSQWLNLLSLPNVYAGFCTRGNDRPGVRDADVERRAVNSEIQWSKAESPPALESERSMRRCSTRDP